MAGHELPGVLGLDQVQLRRAARLVALPCCGRRVAVLYGGKVYASRRHCHKLAYPTQRQQADYRATARRTESASGWAGTLTF
jgi:hypothetical protein